MKLRNYKAEDSAIICRWIKTEDELYKWSADRFNKFPLHENDIEDTYVAQMQTGRFIPISAVNDDDQLIGHFIIRYPDEDDDTRVRFGFVIVAPKYRGKGYGKEMLQLGIRYVKENLKAEKIDLGVFENNQSAVRCYESVGFKEYQRRTCEFSVGTWVCIDMKITVSI